MRGDVARMVIRLVGEFIDIVIMGRLSTTCLNWLIELSVMFGSMCLVVIRSEVVLSGLSWFIRLNGFCRLLLLVVYVVFVLFRWCSVVSSRGVFCGWVWFCRNRFVCGSVIMFILVVVILFVVVCCVSMSCMFRL